MKQKTSISQKNSIKTALVFIVFVGFIIFIAISIKAFVSLRNGQFDGKHRFTFAVLTNKTTAVVYSIDPKSRTSSTLFVKSKNLRTLESSLGIILNDFVYLSSAKELPEGLPNATINILLSWNVKKKLTFFDLLGIFYQSLFIPKKNHFVERTNLPQDTYTLNQLTQRLFVDNAILEERIPVSIVNATGISGFGSRLERVLANAGFNIVAVTTSQKIFNHSKIVLFTEPTYTLKSIVKYLNFPVESKNEASVSDIMVIIGQDSIDTNKF